MKNYTILIVLVALLFGCSSERQPQIVDVKLKEAVNIEGKSLNIEGVNIVMPAKILINDEKLIVFQPIPEKMFTVIDLQSTSHLYSYGNTGKASTEFKTRLSNENIISYNNSIEVYEFGQLHKIIFGNEDVDHKAENIILRSDISNLNGVRKINEENYYCVNPLENEPFEYIIFNKTNDSLTYFGEYPTWNEDPTVNKQMEYGKSSVCSEKAGKIFTFYYKYPKFKIRNTKGELLSTVQLSDYPKNDEDKMFFVEPFLSDKYLYVLFANISKKDMQTDISKFKPQLLVFDFYGNPIASYQMNKPIITYAVKDNKTVYCGVYPTGEDTNLLYEYNLPL